MKNKNYLVRNKDGSFYLARGIPMNDNKTLALVHAWSRNDLAFPWVIIDIASGLTVARGTTKKNCIANYIFKDAISIGGIQKKIEQARQNDLYKTRCEELEVEIHIWRESGYEL